MMGFAREFFCSLGRHSQSGHPRSLEALAMLRISGMTLVLDQEELLLQTLRG